MRRNPMGDKARRALQARFTERAGPSRRWRRPSPCR